MSRPPWTVQQRRNETFFKVILVCAAIFVFGKLLVIALRVLFLAAVVGGVLFVGLFLFNLAKEMVRRGR